MNTWTRTFAETLKRLYPETKCEDAMAIAHGRYFVEPAVDPTEAAELYALSEGRPSQRRSTRSRG